MSHTPLQAMCGVGSQMLLARGRTEQWFSDVNRGWSNC